MKINQSILLDFTNNCVKKKKNARTGVVHNSFYNSTIPSVYHIRAMESAKYVTVIYCGTGQKYGQKRLARFLILLAFLRGDFFSKKLRGRQKLFGHHEHLDGCFCQLYSSST